MTPVKNGEADFASAIVTGTGTTGTRLHSGGEWAQAQIQHGKWELTGKEQNRGQWMENY